MVVISLAHTTQVDKYMLKACKGWIGVELMNNFAIKFQLKLVVLLSTKVVR